MRRIFPTQAICQDQSQCVPAFGLLSTRLRPARDLNPLEKPSQRHALLPDSVRINDVCVTEQSTFHVPRVIAGG
jgi:hypothetical protein